MNMVSKESDYLIQVAEEQLRRLNKSLLCYEKKNGYDSSINSYRTGDYEPVEYSDSVQSINDINFDKDFRSIHKIIERQQKEYTVMSKEKHKKQKRPPIQANTCFDNISYTNQTGGNIRDWRTGVSLARQAFGSTCTSPHKVFNEKLPPKSSEPVNKKNSRVSTFWDFDSQKRIGKIPKSSSTKEISKAVDRCTKKVPYNRNEIRKYIKEKQNLSKVKHGETDSLSKRRSNNRYPLNNFQPCHHETSKQTKPLSNTSLRKQEHWTTMTGIPVSLSESRINQTVYDELKTTGIIDNEDNSDFRNMSGYNSTNALRASLRSTVDSGFETGEWYVNGNPSRLKRSYDSTKSLNAVYPESSPKKTYSKYGKPPHRSYSPNKYRSHDYFESADMKSRDQISAYDASSENEAVKDKHEFNPKFFSVGSSPTFAKTDVLAHVDEYLNKVNSKSFCNSTDSNDNRFSVKSVPGNCVEYVPEDKFHSISHDTESTVSSQSCFIEDLKQALIEAQMNFSSDSQESDENISARISQAVQNFIKTREQIDNSSSSLKHRKPVDLEKHKENVTKNALSVNFAPNPDHDHHHISDLNSSKSNASETSSDVQTIPSQLPTLPVMDENESIENRLSRFMDAYDIDGDPEELLENQIQNKLIRRKQILRLKEERAKELIVLVNEYRKEAKRVKQLLRKANEFSKRYIPSLNVNSSKTHGVEMESPGIRNVKDINMMKFERHSIPPDGIDVDQINYNPMSVALKQSADPFGEGEKSGESLQLGGGLLNHGHPSEVDETTLSVSEITTTLSDQSELEAKLIALRAELDKKRQYVSVLKKRQKSLKRDKIKEKESALENQIVLYDQHIESLQSRINGLERRSDLSESEDSNTLKESILNSNNDVVQCKINEDSPKSMPQDFPVLDFHDPNVSKNVFPPSTKDDTVYHTPSPRSSIDSIFDNNNMHLDNEEGDLSDLCQKEEMLVNVNVVQNVEHPTDVLNEIDVFLPDKQADNGFVITEVSDSVNIDAHELQRAISTDYFDQIFLTNNNESQDNRLEVDIKEIYSKECNDTNNENNESLDNFVDLYLDDVQNKFSDNIFCRESDFNTTGLSDNKCNSSKTSESSESAVNITKLADDNEDKKDYGDEILIETNKSKENDIWTDVTPGNKDPFLDENCVLIVENHKTDDDTKNSPIDNVFHIEKQNELTCTEGGLNDDSSLSDVDLLNITEEKPLIEISDQNASPQTNISVESVNVNYPSPPPRRKQKSSAPLHLANAEEIIQQTDKCLTMDDGKHITLEKVDELVENLLNRIIVNEIERFKAISSEVVIENPVFVSLPMDLQAGAKDELMDKSVYDLLEKDDDFTDVPQTEELEDVVDNTTKDVDVKPTAETPRDSNLISVVDKEILRKRLPWLVPLKLQYVEPLIESSIRHFFEARRNRQGTTQDALINAQNSLPIEFEDSTLVVTETEVATARFDKAAKQSFIDKRIIFKLVFETFLEIYSFENHLPQMPWIHPSLLMKKKSFSLWKYDRPPESYDLVRSIVFQRISQFINQNKVFLPTQTTAAETSSAQSKIIKWCIDKQKDPVDRLLINDMRKEENEWVYYDEAEEEVKFQVAEDIFNTLIADTVSWLSTLLSHSSNC